MDDIVVAKGCIEVAEKAVVVGGKAVDIYDDHKMYECVLQNSDDQEIERIVISKESLTVCKGKEITVKHINNDFVQMMY